MSTSDSSKIDSRLRGKDRAHTLLISVGSGGVGKTTLSAVCGMSAAQKGSKTLVITIDPAKRLAEALGVKGEVTAPVQVDKGFHLMMLDMPRAWDDLIRRQYDDEEKIQAIFDNRFYHYLSRELAGSQELIAGEALLEIHDRNDYDFIVLDTPPSVHAIDFLDAPSRIINFLSNDTVVGVIERYGGKISERGTEWISKGGSILQSIVQKLVGKGFFMELVEFFVLLQDLIKPMVSRAREFESLIKSEETAFQIVTSTQPHAMDEAVLMQKALEARGYRLSRVLVNRVVPAFGHSRFRRESCLIGEKSPDLARMTIVCDHLDMLEEDRLALEKLSRAFGAIAIVPIEALPCDVHSTEGLSTLVEQVSSRK